MKITTGRGSVHHALRECWRTRDYGALVAGLLLYPYFLANQAYHARLARQDRAARLGYALWKARGRQ